LLELSVSELFSVAELSFLLSVTELSLGGVVSPTPTCAELLVQPNSISADKMSAVVLVSFFMIDYLDFVVPRYFLK